MAIKKELLDRLLVDYKYTKLKDLIGENGLLKQLTKALFERALQAEMTVHLQENIMKHTPKINLCRIKLTLITFWIAVTLCVALTPNTASSADHQLPPLEAHRGEILDQYGRLLVGNSYLMDISWNGHNLRRMNDQEIDRLSVIIGIEAAIIREKVRLDADRKTDGSITLATGIPVDNPIEIRNKLSSFPDITLTVQSIRNYPHGDLAGHLLGYVGNVKENRYDYKLTNLKREDRSGVMGVEKAYDALLRPDNVARDSGNTLQLTLDLDLQKFAEEAIGDNAGAVLAMDIRTGAIRAWVSAPELPLRDLTNGLSKEDWDTIIDNPRLILIDKPLQFQSPPGSPFKLVTAMAALQEGIITPETIFDCNGSLLTGGRSYYCQNKQGDGPVDVRHALQESCDVFFYQLALQLGIDKLAYYSRSMGFGSKTGIDLGYEMEGVVPSASWKEGKFHEPWREGDTLPVAIGQGYNLVTPLQMCRFTAALANGGKLLRPMILSSIRNHAGTLIKDFSPIEERKIEVKPEILMLIRDTLQGKMKGDGNFAGITGTASRPHPSLLNSMKSEDIPYEYQDNGWFTGYVPAESPRIAVTVLIMHGGSGSIAAKPVAVQIMNKILALEERKSNVPKVVRISKD
jgi:penicillin-binding protein 2